ncbi:hypothetical protein D3C71_2225280 [compost metagenome]
MLNAKQSAPLNPKPIYISIFRAVDEIVKNLCVIVQVARVDRRDRVTRVVKTHGSGHSSLIA